MYWKALPGYSCSQKKQKKTNAFKVSLVVRSTSSEEQTIDETTISYERQKWSLELRGADTLTLVEYRELNQVCVCHDWAHAQ